MKNLKIEETNYTPRVDLNENGRMSIIGKSLVEDANSFYRPIIENIKKCESKDFILEIKLEYMNTSSSKVMLMLLKAIKETYTSNNVHVRWYYERGDEDMLDLALDYESILIMPIDVVEVCEEEYYN